MLISEDWEFCRKAQEVGIKTYADTSILLGHIGKRTFVIDDAVNETQRKRNQEIKKGGILDPNEAQYVLDTACDILKKLNITHWVDSGTLLGGVRDKAINIFDHDVDVRCFRDEVDEAAMTKIVSKLYNAGFTTIQQNHGERKQLLAVRNRTMLDLKFCERNENYVWSAVWDWSPGSSANPDSVYTVHVFPVDYFKEFGVVEIQGKEYPCPKSVEAYLMYHYGKNWREFKVKPEDVDMTDLQWDARYSPPCSMTLEEFQQLAGT